MVYNLNFQRIAASDTAAASLLPFSLWLDGSIAADRFYPYLAQHAPAQALGFFVKDGHAYSGYPIAVPLLLAPLYAPAALVVRAGAWDTERIVVFAGILEKLTASLVAAVSVVFFYFLALSLAGPGRALVVTLAYAFATETWTISSQALWQHGASELAVIAGLFCLARWWEAPGAATPAGAGWVKRSPRRRHPSDERTVPGGYVRRPAHGPARARRAGAFLRVSGRGGRRGGRLQPPHLRADHRRHPAMLSGRPSGRVSPGSS